MTADVGLSHIDLDNIGERFEHGSWTARDFAALFLEIARLNAVVEDQAKAYELVIDFDGERVGITRTENGVVGSICFLDPDDETPDWWEPIYRRVPVTS